jgi:hypothetical protein
MYWANEPGSGPGAHAHASLGWGTNGTWLNTFVQWPSISARLMLWLGPAVVEGGVVDGWLYWAANNWVTAGAGVIRRLNGTLYTDAAKAHSTPIGDGVLFYSTEDGVPVPSLRYLNLADGVEDNEGLFRQCAGRCTDLLRRLVRSGDQWTDDPLLLEATRREAARRILFGQALKADGQNVFQYPRVQTGPF